MCLGWTRVQLRGIPRFARIFRFPCETQSYAEGGAGLVALAGRRGLVPIDFPFFGSTASSDVTHVAYGFKKNGVYADKRPKFNNEN